MSKAIKAIAGVVITAIGFATGNPALIRFGITLIVSNALDVIAQALVGKPRIRRLGQDIEYFGTVEPRRIIYGKMRVSGMNAIPPWTSGTTNKFLHQVLCVAGHEVEDITDVYFGQEIISDAAIDPISGTLNDGKVVSGIYENKAWIRRYSGDQTSADYILDTAFPDWTSNHKGLGIAYLAIQYELDDEVYRSGKPEVTAIVFGKKCYDPRLDTAPGADPTNAAYIAYTTNPALCLTDYLTSSSIGLNTPAARIDWDLVVAAANICDEQVSIPSATQDRYTCNVVLYVAVTDDERRENVRALVGAMMGHVVYRGGKWRIYAGAATSSTFDLDEDDLVGRFSIRTEISANEKYNYVRGQFVDSGRNYQLSEFEPRVNATFEADDGDRFPREVIFEACTDPHEAQRNAIIVLNRSRRKKQLSGIWGMSAFKIRPWDVGTVTLEEMGWTDQLVRCTAWEFRPNGTVEATFIEELASDWDDPDVGDYDTPSVGSGPGPADYIPDPPDSFTVTPAVDGLILQWDRADSNQIQTLFNIYSADDSSPLPVFSSSPTVVTKIVSRFNGNGMFLPRTDDTTKHYWITAFDLISGEESEPRPPTTGVPGTPLSITAGYRLTVDRGLHYKVLVGTGSGTTTNTSTVTAIDGTPTYTHSWVRISGSTKISVVSASSATTGFSATGLADEELVNAIFEDTVTDSSSPQQVATITVSVAFERDDSFGS